MRQVEGLVAANKKLSKKDMTTNRAENAELLRAVEGLTTSRKEAKTKCHNEERANQG